METKSIEWLLDHASNVYEAEKNDFNKVRERTGFIITSTLTPIVGADVYLATTFRGDSTSCLNIILFWVPLGLSITLLLVSTVFVAYLLHQSAYINRPPSPSNIMAYFQEHTAPESVLADAQLGLLKEYSAAIDANFALNDKRKRKVLWAQRFAFYSLAVLMLLCAPKWIYNFINIESKAQNVKISSPIIVQPLQENTNDKQKPSERQ